MNEPTPNPEDLLIDANIRLEATAAANANQAFNLGCSLVLLPGMILVLLVFLLSKGNWIMGGGAAILVTMASLLIANLVALITKQRSLERTYTDFVRPELESGLQAANLYLETIRPIASQILPETAALLQFLPIPKLDTQDQEFSSSNDE